MKMPAYMELDKEKTLVDGLAGDQEERLEAVINIKNIVIGNKIRKTMLIELGTIQKLVEMISRDDSSIEFIIEAVVVLGSFARVGTKESLGVLLKSHALHVLLKGICHHDRRVVEASARSLRTLYQSNGIPCDPIYENPRIIPRLVELLSGSYVEAESAATIISKCCQSAAHQALLCNTGAVDALLPLLSGNIAKIQLPSLHCYAAASHQNGSVSLAMMSASHQGEGLLQVLTKRLSRDNPDNIQLGAAKCLTNMFRSGAFSAEDNHSLLLKVLSTTVRICREDKPSSMRAEAAETLAYLIEEDIELQRLAAISDHLIKTMIGFLQKNNMDSDTYNLMRESALKALASLGATDENIRKKIIESDTTMDHVVAGLEDVNPHVQLAAVKCLHSLSRSVQQLRTSFQDTAVWKPIVKIMHNADEGMLTVCSSALCNLLLEFSPSKEPILEAGAVALLAGLTRRSVKPLKLNGIWALMNMAYQANETTKNKIMEVLGAAHLFSLLEDSDTDVVMKALGLMRNLLSGREDINRIMTVHGNQVMNSVKPILDSELQKVEVKEQALCVIANIANGTSAKEFIVRDEGLLKRLMYFMMHESVKLQMAATYCISNLVWNTEEGAMERQVKLRDMGVQKLLQSLLTTTDAHLFERVKTALQQFT